MLGCMNESCRNIVIRRLLANPKLGKRTMRAAGGDAPIAIDGAGGYARVSPCRGRLQLVAAIPDAWKTDP